MDEKSQQLKILRYLELSARKSRQACDSDCQAELAKIREELALSHETLVEKAKELLERM